MKNRNRGRGRTPESQTAQSSTTSLRNPITNDQNEPCPITTPLLPSRDMPALKKGRKGTEDASKRALTPETALVETNRSQAGSRTAFKQWEPQVGAYASGVECRAGQVEVGVTHVPRELHQTRVDEAAFNIGSGQHPRVQPFPPLDPSSANRDEGGIGVRAESDHRSPVESSSTVEIAETRKKAEEAEIWRKEKAEETETWKKRAEEAERRAGLAEGHLAEANRHLDAERATFSRQLQQSTSQLLEAEDRTNRLQAALNDSEEELRRSRNKLRDTAARAEEAAMWRKRAEGAEVWRKKAEEAETSKKRVEEAEERAGLAEGHLAEANRHLDAERATFSRQLQQSTSQLLEAEDRTNRLQAAVADSDQELRRTRNKLRDTAALANEAEGRARLAETRLAEANKRLDAEQATFNHQAQQAKRQLLEADDRANRLQAALTESEQELRRTRNKLRDTVALADTRYDELQDANAYLTGLDNVADSEVLYLVEGINSKIFQTAGSITDVFQPRCGEQKDIQVAQEAAERLRGLLGDDLLRELSSIHQSDDSLMQTLLQAVMVSTTKRLCATWDFDFTGAQRVLQDLHYFIRQNERPSVAGRWRALSRTYAKMFVNDEKDPERRGSEELGGYITDTLLVCGAAGALQDLRTEVGSRYADALRGVVHLSLEFQRITGEDIVSRDLLIVDTTPGEPFDPSRMDDEWADPKEVRHRVDPHFVLCTTRLGLAREEKKATGDEEAIATVILLKPKVALTSLLEELLNEQGRGAYPT